MWPWEHAAFGYLCYSVAARAWTGDPPGAGAVATLAVATQFPDLVDKPLAWSLGILPSGTSLAHSVLVAVPVSVLAVLAGRRTGHRAAGAAFAVGYLSHLAGDVIYPVALGGRPAVGAVLWPLVATNRRAPVGLATRTGELFASLLAHLSTPAGVLYAVAEAALLGAALALWLVDGAPGLAPVGGALRERWAAWR